MEDLKSILVEHVKYQNEQQLQLQERMEEKWQKQLLQTQKENQERQMQNEERQLQLQ